MGNCLEYLKVDNNDVKLFHSIVANNVKIIRKSKNITQLDLALTIGHKSVSTIGKIEASLENKHYNVEQLYKISKVLDVDICEFFKNPKHINERVKS